MSPPSRAAWIEIVVDAVAVAVFVSPPSRAAWIEMKLYIEQQHRSSLSPPSRAAWIEISVSVCNRHG